MSTEPRLTLHQSFWRRACTAMGKFRHLDLFAMAVVASIFLYGNGAHAGVNVKNGNFYIWYTDVVTDGIPELAISRTYNSRSVEVGWFGFGWGNPYETHLEVGSDGAIVIFENGVGNRTIFYPQVSVVDPDFAVNRLLKGMIAADRIHTRRKLADYRDKFESESYLRRGWSSRMVKEGHLTPLEPAIGDQFVGANGFQTIEATEDGYIRRISDGDEQHFDRSGRLTQITAKNGNITRLDWSSDKRNLKISNSVGSSILIEFNEAGLVSKAKSGARSATYKYDGNDLNWSKDVEGNIYTYTYDENHNMRSIAYADGTRMQMFYAPKTQFVDEVIQREGGKAIYQYYSYENEKGEADLLHYGTVVQSTAPDGKHGTNRFDYLIGRKNKFGDEYVARIAFTYDSGATGTTDFNKDGLPVRSAYGDKEIVYEYEDGLLTKQSSSDGTFVRYQYHPDFRKKIYVENNDGWTRFSYDGNGNLIYAENSKGQTVTLEYNDQQQISSMIDQDAALLTFKYDKRGHPSEISMEGVGTIKVEYGEWGEIKKVESDGDQKLALAITQKFQNLLSIIRPAGVYLGM